MRSFTILVAVAITAKAAGINQTTDNEVNIFSGEGSGNDSVLLYPSALSPLPSENGPTLLEIAAGVIIGLSGGITLVMLSIFAFLHCYLHRDRVPDWNTLEYCIQEEYEARINFEALEKLDPAIRAGIDMDVLANITHTDPALLAKYKPRVPQESTSSTPRAMRSPAQCLSRSSSLHRMNFDSIDKKLSQKIQTIKRNSLDGGNLRRVRTLSDVNGTDSNRGSLSSMVTIVSGRKDSGGTTYLIERHPSQAEGPADLLKVLSISTCARPRSMTDISDMMASRLEQEEAEQRRKYEEAKKARKKKAEEGKSRKEREEAGLAMKIEVRVEEVNEEGKMEAAKQKTEVVKMEDDINDATIEIPLATKRALLKRKSSLGWEAVKREVEATKRAAAEEEIAKQEALKEERAEQLRAIRKDLIKAIMETPV